MSFFTKKSSQQKPSVHEVKIEKKKGFLRRQFGACFDCGLNCGCCACNYDACPCCG